MNRWLDWYEQGQRDYKRAEIDIKYEYYEWACFTFQQSSEKILKALALKKGITVWGHSLTGIINILNEKVEIPEDIRDKAKLLDIYYIPTRYPNGFAIGKPSDYFTKKQALEAMDAANCIIRFCKSFLYQ